MTIFDTPILLTFWLLIAMNLKRPKALQQLRYKPKADWILDVCGLIVQGIVIPALQVGLLYQGLHWLWPQAANSLTISPVLSFLVCVVLIDYGYYWNHRWLHAYGWAIHQVHHTVTHLDVLGTSRNSLWSSLFILYLWIHALMLYLLKDPNGYLWGISLTAMLDLWRHSQLGPEANGWLYSLLSPWLTLPQDHAIHHSKQMHTYNFGANLKLWDRLHGTAKTATGDVSKLGIKTSLNLWQKLLYPFELL